MVRCSSAMPLQHHSAFGPAVYSPHADYLLKNVLVYPPKYLPNIHIPLHPAQDVALFDSDEWHPHYHPHHHQHPYSPPRIKQEDLPLYSAIPSYPSHDLLVQQSHRNYGLEHHHDTSQQFALFEGHHHSIPSHPQPQQHSSHSTYYSPPFQNHHSIPQPPQQITRSSFEHQQSHQAVPLSAAYVRPAEVSPSAESIPPLSPYPDTLSSNTTTTSGSTHTSWLDDERSSLSSLESDMVMSGSMELEPIVDDMDASAVVSGMDVIAMQGNAVEGNEEDAEGEEDWSHVCAHDTTIVASQYSQQPHYGQRSESEPDAGHRSSGSDHGDGNLHDPTQPIDSVPPVPSEEELSSSTASSDEEFEVTSEDDEEEADDDDDEFVLHPRQRRSISSLDIRRRSRGSLSGHPSLSKTGASEGASNGFVPYSMTEGRSLRSRSATGRYNPYPGYSDYYPEQTPLDEVKLTVPTTPGRRRTRASSSFGVPVPVPNLTKKSRGRRVPTMSSLEDLRSAASGAGKKRQSAGGKSARMYLCDVEGCGKCFARGEHLKRHVRSIHTYEKPHKCPYPGCGKDFSRHDNLGQHMRVHKDYSPSASMRRKSQQA